MFTRKNLKSSFFLKIFTEGDEDYPTVETVDKADIKIPWSQMEVDEANEKHLQEALKEQSAIPTPDIEMIEDEAYDQIYTEVKRPRFGTMKVWTLPDPNMVDYDADEEDEKWLENYPQIELLSFERVIEWLELELRKKVPLLDDLKASANTVKSLKLYEIEEIYDYWIDKRLRTKKPLMSAVKIGVISSESRKDPYQIFRPPDEKILGTRNRKQLVTEKMKMYQNALKTSKRLKFIQNNVMQEIDKENVRQSCLRESLATFIYQHRNPDRNGFTFTDDEIKYFNDLKEKKKKTDSTGNSSGFYSDFDDAADDAGPYTLRITHSDHKFYKPILF